ncbi:MAG TPA: AAA family ATPase [Thermodesulfovibrionales bacterium]|nr:AAA family ATPase [Thermodesulfovibrionales bacterium]
MSSLNISIANLNFTVHSGVLPILAEPLSPSYLPFVGTNQGHICEPPAIDILIETEVFPSTREMTEILENCGSWSMLKKGNDYYLVINPALSEGPESIVRFEPCFDNVTVYCRDMSIVEVEGSKFVRNPFTYPLDQILVMYVLAERRGALLHSSGVVCDGKVYVFCGKSGAGKSTVSRHFRSAGYEVLSDDRIAARKMGDAFWAFGTPWSGEAGISMNKGLPLGGIFFISHHHDNVIREITPAGAAERLMPITSIPWYDQRAMTGILSFCEEVVLGVPAYELQLRPEREVVDYIERFMSRQ